VSVAPAPVRPPASRGRRRLGPARAGALAIVAVAVALRLLVLEPFAVPSTSMRPTLEPGDHVLADKLAYRLGDPAVGDLAVLDSPRRGLLLKRVVALGGAVVELRDGVLHVDGRPRREPYVDLARVDGVYFGPVTVPAGHVFVLGDSRGESEDSRDLGPVPHDALVARVAARIWPPARIGAP
jgi:signal peptidase I